MTYQVDACRQQLAQVLARRDAFVSDPRWVYDEPTRQRLSREVGDAYLALAKALLGDYPPTPDKLEEANRMLNRAKKFYNHLRDDDKQELDEIAEAWHIHGLVGEQLEAINEKLGSK